MSSLIVPCQKYFDDTKDESKWIGTIFTAITKDYQRAIEEVLEGKFFGYFKGRAFCVIISRILRISIEHID